MLSCQRGQQSAPAVPAVYVMKVNGLWRQSLWSVSICVRVCVALCQRICVSLCQFMPGSASVSVSLYQDLSSCVSMCPDQCQSLLRSVSVYMSVYVRICISLYQGLHHGDTRASGLCPESVFCVMSRWPVLVSCVRIMVCVRSWWPGSDSLLFVRRGIGLTSKDR